MYKKRKSKYLALPPADPTLKESVSYKFTIQSRKIEQAGLGYAQLQLDIVNEVYKTQNNEVDDEQEENGTQKYDMQEEIQANMSENTSMADHQEDESDSYMNMIFHQICSLFNKEEDYEKKRRRKTKLEIEKKVSKDENLYGVLGIEDKIFEATTAQIGKQYKRAALHFHPDKIGRKITERDREVWLKIQNAYETLSDPVKRRKYDSSLPFDDSIPEDSEITSDKRFFNVFKHAFANNSRFAVNKPVPVLGNPSTPIEEVDQFYKYWFNFKSWRDFSQYDEYDLEEAADRFESRWMDQQNKRARSEYEREERKRVYELVTRSYKHDPRIREEQEKEKARKLAAKKQKKANKVNYYKELEEKRKLLEDQRLEKVRLEEETK